MTFNILFIDISIEQFFGTFSSKLLTKIIQIIKGINLFLLSFVLPVFIFCFLLILCFGEIRFCWPMDLLILIVKFTFLIFVGLMVQFEFL